MIAEIIKVEMSRSEAETLIILDITKTESKKKQHQIYEVAYLTAKM